MRRVGDLIVENKVRVCIPNNTLPFIEVSNFFRYAEGLTLKDVVKAIEHEGKQISKNI